MFSLELQEVLPYCTIGRVDGGDPLEAVTRNMYEISEKLGNLFAFEEVLEMECDCVMRRPALKHHFTRSVSGPPKFSFCDFFTFWAKSRTCQCGKTCRSIQFPSTTRYLLLCLNCSPPYS
ncbi:hypothetical protein L596_025556 [Steinernema carpocapsae]|uniref:Uncharacterized protein n=1 Tax=Steinernema carpocapsae TaxID=34508 RepID=A0A4U5M8B3_STECR|nr:hypothetical protein L596_025556 [Steinernema carpocapsae]